MKDKILEAFLKRQSEETLALNAASDLVKVLPVEGDPPQRYVTEFYCNGLVWRNGAIVEGNQFAVGIWMPDDYLRHTNPAQVLTWLSPPTVWHPNVLAPYVCIGPIAPGTSLTDLIHRLYDVITYNKVTMREDNALNKNACVWARQNLHRFPVDRRPLKRRRIALQVEPVVREEEV